MRNNLNKFLSVWLCVMMVATIFVVAGNANAEVSTSIVPDPSFPQRGDYDYAVFDDELSASNLRPVAGEEVEITAKIHNLALCKIEMWHANPSHDYNGEWVEYDFYQPIDETLDIIVRATDNYCPGTHVDVNFFLDGQSGKVASFDMYESEQWQLLTAHNVFVEEGWHTLRVTMVYGEVPRDIIMDWVEIGDIHIEAENYNRTGGTGATRWDGVDSIYPRNVLVRFYDGNPASGGVLIGEDIPGKTNTMNDCLKSPYHFDVKYIEDNGSAYACINWIATLGIHDIYVWVDPLEELNEIDETNNIAHITLTVPIPATIDIDPDTLNLKSKGKWITCYIELPDGYDVANINISTVKISKVDDTEVNIPAEEWPGEIDDYDNDGIPDLMVKFDRSAVQSVVSVGNVIITVEGFVNDTLFEGTDTIEIIDQGKEHTNEDNASSVDE